MQSILIEAIWEKVENKELLKELGCKMAFKGVITNKRQFTQLDRITSAEDQKLLYARSAVMKKLKNRKHRILFQYSPTMLKAQR